MSNQIILLLSEEWAILADRQQWIIAKSRKRLAKRDWDPKKYIGSTKSRLLSAMLKMGIEVAPEAEDELASWPERFVDWMRTNGEY